MSSLLPLVLLVSAASLFGLSWVVVSVDPDTAQTYIFGLFVVLLFFSVWGFFGLVLYFVRTRLYKHYDANWYFKTSFKMAFFVALFIAVAAILGIVELVTLKNVALAIIALALFATWSYLGRKE